MNIDKGTIERQSQADESKAEAMLSCTLNHFSSADGQHVLLCENTNHANGDRNGGSGWSRRAALLIKSGESPCETLSSRRDGEERLCCSKPRC